MPYCRFGLCLGIWMERVHVLLLADLVQKGRYELVQPTCQQCGGCAHVGLTWKTVTRDHNRVSKFARSDTHPLVALAHSWQEHGVPSGRAQNLPPKTLMPRILHAARGKHTHNQVRVVVLCWGVASDEQLEQGAMSAKLSAYTLNPLSTILWSNVLNLKVDQLLVTWSVHFHWMYQEVFQQSVFLKEVLVTSEGGLSFRIKLWQITA